MTMLTLFADASFCPHTGASGWGSWAIRDGWPKGLFHGGVIRRPIENSTEAELCALASALWAHEQAGDLAEVTIFMLQSDSTHALGTIYRAVPSAAISRLKNNRNAPIMPRVARSKLEREAVEHIQRIVTGHQVRLRHVKGHNGTDDGRSWVNDQCDKVAKRHMQARRLELKEQAA